VCVCVCGEIALVAGISGGSARRRVRDGQAEEKKG
jgi:hypothetical protein